MNIIPPSFIRSLTPKEHLALLLFNNSEFGEHYAEEQEQSLSQTATYFDDLKKQIDESILQRVWDNQISSPHTTHLKKILYVYCKTVLSEFSEKEELLLLVPEETDSALQRNDLLTDLEVAVYTGTEELMKGIKSLSPPPPPSPRRIDQGIKLSAPLFAKSTPECVDREILHERI